MVTLLPVDANGCFQCVRFLCELRRSPSRQTSPQRGSPHTLWTTQVLKECLVHLPHSFVVGWIQALAFPMWSFWLCTCECEFEWLFDSMCPAISWRPFQVVPWLSSKVSSRRPPCYLLRLSRTENGGMNVPGMFCTKVIFLIFRLACRQSIWTTSFTTCHHNIDSTINFFFFLVCLFASYRGRAIGRATISRNI